MKLLIASGNPDKIREISAILKQEYKDIEFDTLIGKDIPEPDEPYETFLENAKHKAKYYADIMKEPCLSEDAGVCVNALDDFPGIRTKRFVNECGGLQQAFNKLEDMLSTKDNNKGKYVCCACIYFPDNDTYLTFEGVDRGSFTFPPRGKEGFGFDPLFIPDGQCKTIAELGQEFKDKHSHRALALAGLMKELLPLMHKG